MRATDRDEQGLPTTAWRRAGGRPFRSKAWGQGTRGSRRAAGLAKYEGPTSAHVTRWAALILLVFGKELRREGTLRWRRELGRVRRRLLGHPLPFVIGVGARQPGLRAFGPADEGDFVAPPRCRYPSRRELSDRTVLLTSYPAVPILPARTGRTAVALAPKQKAPSSPLRRAIDRGEVEMRKRGAHWPGAAPGLLCMQAEPID